jgi:hypothetical protein
VAGSRNDHGLHLGAFLTRGVHWRTGRSDALGGERAPIPDAPAQPNGLGGEKESSLAIAPRDADPGSPSPTRDTAPAPLFAREGAVAAYCLELCGPAAARIATEEVIASPRLSGALPVAPEGELLRVTRATASGFAPQVLHPGSSRVPIEGPQRECAFTIPRLARRANAELDQFSEAALAGHLRECIVCRAAEARFDRAERAFAVVLGVTPAVEVAAPPPVEVAPPPPPPPPPIRIELVAAPPPPAVPIAVWPPPVARLEATPPATSAATAGPHIGDAGPSASVPRHRSPLGRWTVLIATLLVGAVVVAVIALLW